MHPKWPLKLLAWICPDSLYESIEGDLLEAFDEDVAQRGEAIARRRFIWRTLSFIRLDIMMRNKFKPGLMNTTMFGSYFKVAIRNIQKRKLYSLINASGLSIGIAFCLLIWLFIRDEMSFDRFHATKDRIYRIDEVSHEFWNTSSKNKFSRSAYLQLGFGAVAKEELRDVEYSTRFLEYEAIVKNNDQVFTEAVHLVDPDFFRMFTFPLLSGNPGKLFQTKEEIVLTSEMAVKYFGDANAMGKTLILDLHGEKSFTVTGIIESPPANSSIEFQFLIPILNRPQYDMAVTRWGNRFCPTFIQVKEGTNLQSLNDGLDKIVTKYMGPMLERWHKEGNVPDDIKMFEYKYIPITDIHLANDIYWHKVSDRKYSYILGGIALLILLIACINYISLALTTSVSRRTEVGVRKVVGAVRSQLFFQFGFESIVLAFASLVIAIGLVSLFLPVFNDYTGKSIALDTTNIWTILAFGFMLALVVGSLSGSYPALFLSRFRPALVLKGLFTTKMQAGFTKPLVVLQFAMSAFLIISSVIMFRQMAFISEKQLGYNKERVLIVPTQVGWNSSAETVVEQVRVRLQNESAIMSVAGTSTSFNRGYSKNGYRIKGVQKSAFVYAVDANYVPALGIQLEEGRNFDPAISSDSLAVIVNEALVRDMGWKDPLNEYLNWTEDSTSLGHKVIGVVKDYHFLSLESEIQPMFLSMNRSAAGHTTSILIKVAEGKLTEGLDVVRTAWHEMYPDKPFDYSFLDEDVANQYKRYQQQMGIMRASTLFAILISCLGLFGLAGINAVNRVKEIGIRKVMGATMGSIFVLLNRQYVFLSLIAFAVAIPFSWYVMDRWLSSFQFRITLGWGIFALSMIAGLAVALLTVSYHALKASTINPAETLKYE